MDADDTLSIYGETRREGRRVYARTLRGEGQREWFGEDPGRLPWWRGPRERDDRIEPSHEGPYVDFLGRSTEPMAPEVTAEAFLESACEVVGVRQADLAGRGKSPELAEVRGLMTLLGVERFGQKVNRIATALDKHPGSLSFAARRYAESRRDDAATRERFEAICAGLMSRLTEMPGD